MIYSIYILTEGKNFFIIWHVQNGGGGGGVYVIIVQNFKNSLCRYFIKK
jgi:hypothetical protein